MSGDDLPEDGSYGYAFPSQQEASLPGCGGKKYRFDSAGMTLRDYFAVRSPFTLDDVPPVFGDHGMNRVKSDREIVLGVLAELSYEWADAMIAARNRRS